MSVFYLILSFLTDAILISGAYWIGLKFNYKEKVFKWNDNVEVVNIVPFFFFFFFYTAFKKKNNFQTR